MSDTPISRWLREPMLHFIIIGALIFAVYAGFNKEDNTVENTQGVSRRITVSEAKLRELMTQFRQNEARSPSHAELTKLADDWVHDEVLYREGLLTAVDRNDPVIRKRVVQLMKWYLVGAGTGGEPGEKELRDYFEASQERYRTGAGLVFEQVFFSTARRGNTAETDARVTMRSFEAGKQTGLEVAIGHGDSLGGDKAQEELQRGDPKTLAQLFGAPFIDTVSKLPFDRWSGPYQSTQGWHVVMHRKPEAPTFQELRAQLRSEVLAQRGNATPEAAFAELLRKFKVEMDSLPEVSK